MLRGSRRGPARGRAARDAWRRRAASRGASLARRMAKAIRARSSSACACPSSSSGPARAEATSPSAASNAPAAVWARAAARARLAWVSGSGVSRTACSRKAAVAAAPPRACARPAQCSSSAARFSSGPGAPWARCHARRSGSVSGSVAAASARWTAWRSLVGRGAVDRRADQRVAESDAFAELAQVRGGRGLVPRPVDSGVLGRAPDDRRIAERLGGRDQQQALCRRAPGSRLGAGSSPRSRSPGAQARADRSRPRVRRASTHAGARGWPTGSRASPRRSGHGPARPTAHGPPTATACAHRRSARPADLELWQPGQLAVDRRGSRREDHRHRFRQQAAGHEGQRLRRRAIEPLRVVDHADQRLRAGAIGEQPEHGQGNEEPVRHRSGLQPERRADGLTLRVGKCREMVEHRRAELMQA